MRAAFRAGLDGAGDRTSHAIVVADLVASATLIARLAWLRLDLAALAFRFLNERVSTCCECFDDHRRFPRSRAREGQQIGALEIRPDRSPR
jgi:hypothetical protein